MTVGGWILMGLVIVILLMVGIAICYDCDASTIVVCIVFVVCLLLGLGTYSGLHYYYTNTASGKRAVIDERSDLGDGIWRKINVYTADGKILAQFEGKIDIESKDGGYVKFDMDGYRYIYYNCFVETVADLTKEVG